MDLPEPKRQPSPGLSSFLNHEGSTVIRKIKSQESMLTYKTSTSTRSEMTQVTCIKVDGQTVESFVDGRKRSFVTDWEGLTAESSAQEAARTEERLLGLLRGRPGAERLEEAVRVLGRVEAVPGHGPRIARAVAEELRKEGGLDGLLENLKPGSSASFPSARLLSRVLTKENRERVVERGLGDLVAAACSYAREPESPERGKVAADILGNLFKHGEGTCGEVVRRGGLDAILAECRAEDVGTLRSCAEGLANLSLFGDSDVRAEMVREQAPLWLHHLAFNDDEEVKYYALIAAAAVAADRPADSDALSLVGKFVRSRDPEEFEGGRCKDWLARLLPVLTSLCEEAANIAAFHFCVEAGVREKSGETEELREIGAVDVLRRVAAAPNAVASRFAARALATIGESVPEKLSQQVPLWEGREVEAWLRHVGFPELVEQFRESRVDGDLLLKLSEEQLRGDLGLSNGLHVSRFLRELERLKRSADYSSRDATDLARFLHGVRPEFRSYTYPMLEAGVVTESLKDLTEEQLRCDCGIENAIHRRLVLDTVRRMESRPKRSLDVFISYRRSNGSQLASLLRVLLRERGFSVFLDVDRLESGKFDYNLLHSIEEADTFLLVLTPEALDRCKEDPECKDWIHKEVVAALSARCNIVPITDKFLWPQPEELPEDMRALCSFNGVDWSHDYQDASLEKIERFIVNKPVPGSPVLLTCPQMPALCSLPLDDPSCRPYPLTPVVCLSNPGHRTREVAAEPAEAAHPSTPPPLTPDRVSPPPTPASPNRDGTSLVKRKSLLRKVKNFVNNS